MYELELYFWSQSVEAGSLAEIEWVVMKWVWCDPDILKAIKTLRQTDRQTTNPPYMYIDVRVVVKKKV